MTYVTAEARQDLLDEVAGAIDRIGAGLAAFGAAYETLDERTADRLEEQLFAPTQTAYGRAKRTHRAFAERVGLPVREFGLADDVSSSRGVKPLVEMGVEAVRLADDRLSSLQDSMLPVDVGDADLRAGLSDVREHLGVVAGHARQFVRTLGR